MKDLGQHSNPIVTKVIAARIVPLIAKYNSHVANGELMDIIKRISSDAEVEANKIYLKDIFPQLLQHLTS